MWKRRDCAGILQLRNYNLVTQVDHAALSPPRPSLCSLSRPCPQPKLFFCLLLWWSLDLFSLENCPYSCCLMLLLLMKISYRWCQGRSPYESHRNILYGCHTGNVCWPEEACRDLNKTPERAKGDCPLRATTAQGKRRTWRKLIAFHCIVFNPSEIFWRRLVVGVF